jgi:hypothetical protein
LAEQLEDNTPANDEPLSDVGQYQLAVKERSAALPQPKVTKNHEWTRIDTNESIKFASIGVHSWLFFVAFGCGLPRGYLLLKKLFLVNPARPSGSEILNFGFQLPADLSFVVCHPANPGLRNRSPLPQGFWCTISRPAYLEKLVP